MDNPIPNNENLVNGKYSITDLVDIDKLRDLFEKFTIATGFTIGFLDHPDMNILVASGWRDICTKFHRSCEAAENICINSNLHLLSQLDEPGKQVIEECEHRLVDCAMPIIIEGKHIASLATGQLLLGKPADKAWFEERADLFGFDKKEYMTALAEIPVVSETQLKAITSFLGSMAQAISEMGYIRMLAIEDAEHLAEEIKERKRIEEERQTLEKKLRQAQKLDAIGLLAGGVAHDFNNMLTGIMGGADLLVSELDGSDELLTVAKNILLSSTRASELTQKLLTVSRQADQTCTTCHMHELLNDILEILSHSIDKNIEVEITKSAKTDTINGDVTQLHNLIVNLALNARDSMPNGGTLEFITREKYNDENYCENSSFEIEAGPYFELEISDSGCGIPEDIHEHIYDPFFTTKKKGEGTGLGLSTVYGMVLDHKGEISMSSKVGVGTTFKVSFPLVDAAPENKEASEDTEDNHKFSGRVLIVDDEEIVLTIGALLLQSLGYDVLSANNGESAIEIFTKNNADFDLVILDLIMPGKSGEEVLNELRAISKTIPVIISSGYSFDICKDTLLKDPLCGFLQKPYTRSDLAVQIKDVLERDSDNPNK